MYHPYQEYFMKALKILLQSGTILQNNDRTTHGSGKA
jgi:hypothetical protein